MGQASRATVVAPPRGRGRPPGTAPRAFVVVADEAEIEAIRQLPVWVSSGRDGSPLFKALANGDTVWLAATTPPKANALGAVARLRKLGWRTHVRPAERSGVEGTYVWADRPSSDARAVRS